MAGMRAPSCRAALAAAIAAVCVGQLSAAPSRGDEIVARAGAYVIDFVHRFSTIVAEERFVQDARRIGTSPGVRSGKRPGNSRDRDLAAAGVTRHQELVSDFLLVKASGLGALARVSDRGQT